MKLRDFIVSDSIVPELAATTRDSAILVIRPFSCNAVRMRRSMASRWIGVSGGGDFICGRPWAGGWASVLVVAPRARGKPRQRNDCAKKMPLMYGSRYSGIASNVSNR